MTSDPTIASKIREYIKTSFSANEEVLVPADEDDLLGVLDSLQMLRMVMDLEALFSIKVDNGEMTPENLGSISKLAAFIASKR